MIMWIEFIDNLISCFLVRLMMTTQYQSNKSILGRVSKILRSYLHMIYFAIKNSMPIKAHKCQKVSTSLERKLTTQVERIWIKFACVADSALPLKGHQNALLPFISCVMDHD